MKNIFVRLGSTVLKLLLAFALVFGLCAEGYAVPPTPTFKMSSHLGVSGKDIVLINTLREGSPGTLPVYTGWTVLRGDGSHSDNR